MSTTEPTTEATGEPTPTNDQLQRLEEAAQLLDASPEIGTLDLSTRAPHPTTHTFRQWLQTKVEDNQKEYEGRIWQEELQHAYSYNDEKRKSARAKDVGRYFVKEYHHFTTILVTYTKPRGDETIAEHAASFYPRKITECRRRCIERANASDGYAGVRLHAPKEGTGVAPTPTTHTHDFLWLPGYAPSEAFDPLGRRDGVHVSIRYHLSEKVSTPSAVNRQDLERERGATTALAQEVGANLPVLTAIDSYREKVAEGSCENEWALEAALDASDCPEYVERWCAEMRLGKDGDIGTPGVTRWWELGRFKEIADNAQERRNGDEDEDVRSVDGGAQDYDLGEAEQDFVDDYLAAGLDPDPGLIRRNIDENFSQFPDGANAGAIVSAIQERQE